MLEKIFSSRIGTRIVLEMARKPYKEFYLYQISKELKTGIGRTKTLLETLRKSGILTSYKSGRRVVYRINEKNRLAFDIISLAHKDALFNLGNEYASNINMLSRIYKETFESNLVSVILFGSVAKKKSSKFSDIDILIITKSKITKKAKDDVHRKLDKAVDVYSNVSEEHYFTKNEFEDSYNTCDDFLMNVIMDGIIISDDSFFSRYLIRGPPKITKQTITSRLKISKHWIDSCLEQYKQFPQSVPSSLGIISLHLARALLLLNDIVPESKHDIPRQLTEIKEERFSKIFATTRKWFDSVPLEIDKERIWKILMFLKSKYDECIRKMEEWA